MILDTQMKDMKIYKQPMYLPTVDGDKKKGAAALLLTPNYASSLALMKNPLLVNKLRYQSYYLNPDTSYYINGKVAKGTEKEEYIREMSLVEMYQNLVEMSKEEKDRLKDNQFGLPKQRKYPLHDMEHVRSAVKFFNYVSKEDEEELAKNILKAMDEFGEYPKISEKNRLYSYLPKDYGVVKEAHVFNTEDIYYNKEKFDSGRTNLCFITGQSGSGKSTMGKAMSSDPTVEWYEMDDVVTNKIEFTMEQLKEYGGLIYTFFKGPGKKYYYTKEDIKAGRAKEVEGLYEDRLVNDFVDYAISYAKSHKDKKFVLEGIWLYRYVNPRKLTSYAVYIKGTSALVSTIRAAKRDAINYSDSPRVRREVFLTRFLYLFRTDPTIGGSSLIQAEKIIDQWRKIFKEEIKKQKIWDDPKVNSYENVRKIYMLMPPREKKRIAPNGDFIDSPYLIYRKVVVANNPLHTPIAFAEIYQFDKTRREGEVVFGTNPHYRQQGHGFFALLVAITWASKSEDIDTLIYRVDKNNKGSLAIIKKFNYPYVEENGQYVYRINATHLSEAALLEYTSKFNSKLSDDFKMEDEYKLNSFRKIPLTNNSREKYKTFFKNHLTNVDMDTSKGFIYIDNSNNQPVAVVIVDYNRNDSGDLKNYNWITDIAIAPRYRGHGLTKQLLDVAVKELHGDFLTVSYDNEVAIHAYKSYGFKITKNSYEAIKDGTSKDHMYLMFYRKHPKGMAFISEDVDILNEYNILHSTDNYEYNMKKFRRNSLNNAVYITGYSGSGKSTTSKKLEEKYGKASVISLDYFTCFLYGKHKGDAEWLKEKDSIIYEYVIDMGPNNFNANISDFEDPALIPYYIKLFDWIALYSQKPENREKLFIIEGIQITMINPEYFVDKPLIIIGTSAIKSWARKQGRDVFDDTKWMKDPTRLLNILRSMKIYTTMNPRLNRLQTVFGEAGTDSSIPEDITDFYNELSKNYKYGAVKNGKPVKNINNFDFYSDYNSITPKEFEKYKAGICYDFVHYEALWFQKNGYQFETYYLEAYDEDGDCPSHTFLVFYLPDSKKAYYFDPPNNRGKGIEEFNSKTELLNTVKNRFIEERDVKCDASKTICVRYTATSTSLEHIGCMDYYQKASNGRTRAVGEACKDVASARKFVADVAKLAKKYDANYFVVTDGASGTHNPNGENSAIQHARDAHKEWERENGFDPEEDWVKGIGESVYRVTYNGEGIYQALRQTVGPIEWKRILSSKEINWLPKPPNYTDGYRSFFTQKGYDIFMKKSYPFICRYLDWHNIKIEHNRVEGKVIYRDEYQVVLDNISFTEATTKEPSKKLYFVSGDNFDGKTLYPRVPASALMDYDNAEDDSTNRICFSPSIDKCLMGLSQNLTGRTYYIHIIDPSVKVTADMIQHPTADQVPDVKITGEVWIIKPVKMKCIGRIKVLKDDGKPGHPYTYGNGRKAELYGWDWEWDKKYPISEAATKEPSKKKPVIDHVDWYNDGKTWNALVYLKGDNIRYRGRSEMIILSKDFTKIYIHRESDKKYRIPGGSWDRNEDHLQSAIRETEEEARITVKDVMHYTTYTTTFKEPKDWVKRVIPKEYWWYGYYTELYVGEYTGRYLQHIPKVDRDNDMALKGRFYPIPEVIDQLSEEHRKAIEAYIKLHKKEQVPEGNAIAGQITDFAGKTVKKMRKDLSEAYWEDNPVHNSLAQFLEFTGYTSDVTKMTSILTPEVYYNILTEDLQLPIKTPTDIPILHVEVNDRYQSNEMRYSSHRNEVGYLVIDLEAGIYNGEVTKEEYIRSFLYGLNTALLESVYPNMKGHRATRMIPAWLTGKNDEEGRWAESIFGDGESPAVFSFADLHRMFESGDITPIYDELCNNFSIEENEFKRNPIIFESVSERFKEGAHTSISIPKVIEFMDGAIVEDTEENILTREILTEFGIESDGILFLEDANDTKLKSLLYNQRIKQRRELVPLLDRVKEDNPEIKYTYTDLDKYKQKNLFIDLYYYNEIFFRNNDWKSDKGYKLYLEFLKRLVNDPRISKAGYKKKTLFIPVLDWNINRTTKMWMYKESINPISIIFNMMRRNPMELQETFGNMDVFFFGKDKFFKINFGKAEEIEKQAIKFSIFIKKFCADEEFDTEDMDTSLDNGTKEAIKAEVIDKIEDEKGIDLTKKVKKAEEKKKSIEKGEVPKEVEEDEPEAPISKAADPKKIKEKEKDLDDLADGVESVLQYAIDADDAINSMEDNDYLKDLLATADAMKDDTVQIDATRAARMNKLDQQFLDSTVNGEKVQALLNDKETNKKLETTSLEIASPNQEWKELTYINFDKDYDLNRDIVACFYHFTKVSKPVAIRKLTAVDNSTSEDNVMLYTAEMEDFKGTRFTIKVDIPIVKDNRLRLRGNSKQMQSQLFNMPIVKTEVDTCQVVTNYQKIFIRQYNTVSGRSLPQAGKLIKALNKYEGTKIRTEPGENQKICNKYEVPIDYIDLSGIFSIIETKQFKFYFNQDQLHDDYPEIDARRGFPYGVEKNSKGKDTILYFQMEGSATLSQVILDYIALDENKIRDLYLESKPSTSGTYSMCSILNTKIPLVIVCAYTEGLTKVLKKANVIYRLLEKMDQTTREGVKNGYWSVIKFEDGYLAYENSYTSNMLLNGLDASGMDRFSITDIDNKNTYLEILDMYGGRAKADGLDNFYDCLVDPITLENLIYYKLPTDFVNILLYANILLCDNKFIKHTDLSSRRIRRTEMIAAYTYEALSESYASYAIMVKHSRSQPKMSMKQSAVIDKILASPITGDDSTINALEALETTNAFTAKGKAGMNDARSYTLDKRMYDDSMLNVLGASTSFSANVAITRQGTMNMNIDSSRGYIKSINGDTSKMNTVNTLTATEGLIPFGTTRDDASRVLMSFVQTSDHQVMTEISDPLLITNGTDEALPYMTTDKFAHKAKEDGKIIELVEEQYMIVEYTSGKREFVNLGETIEKNSNAGSYTPLQLHKKEGLKEGSKIKKNQILAYNRESFSNSLGESENLAYNVGKLAKVAIMFTHEGYEDSGICSESLAKYLTTKVIEKEDHVLDKDSNVFNMAKVGDLVEPGEALLIWQNPHEEEEANTLLRIMGDDQEAVSELGRRTIRSNISGRVADIKIYRTVEIEELSPSLQKIVNAYEAPIKKLQKKLKENNIVGTELPATYKLEPTGKLKKAQDAVLIEFYLEREDFVSVGDKITYFSANKAIIRNVLSGDNVPYTDSRPNEPVDAFVGIVSIDKRMVASIITYGSLQKLIIEMDRSIKDILNIPYDDSKV